MKMTATARKAALLTLGMGSLAATAAGAQQGVRAPSGSGTTIAAQAAANVAAHGTPTTTGMVGAPPPPAPAVKANVAGAAASTAAPVTPGVVPGGVKP